MPEAKNDDLVSLSPIGVAQHITRSTERHDQFAHIWRAGGPAAFRKCFKRLNGGNQSGDGTTSRNRVLVGEKVMESREVVSGGLRDSDFHSLRGFGLGSSFGLPQLPIHALTSSQATPIRLCSNSARRRASSAKASADQGPSPLARTAPNWRAVRFHCRQSRQAKLTRSYRAQRRALRADQLFQRQLRFCAI